MFSLVVRITNSELFFSVVSDSSGKSFSGTGQKMRANNKMMTAILTVSKIKNKRFHPIFLFCLVIRSPVLCSNIIQYTLRSEERRGGKEYRTLMVQYKLK